MNRRTFLAASAAAVGQASFAAPEKGGGSFGIVIHSYGIHSKEKGFTDPLKFLAFCRERGADGIQIPLGHLSKDEAKALRTETEKHGMYVEGSIRLPKDKADFDRYMNELAINRDCGAKVLRAVLSPGRRYEAFDSAEAFAKFQKAALPTLQLAALPLSNYQVELAVENHKDFRSDEFVDLLKAVSSLQLGACIDTGNSIALLEDPLYTVKALAPWAKSCHLKDMAVEESTDGFLLSEVPLGDGYLDLKSIVKTLRDANKSLRFNLEMITRDPLRIRCLTPAYWNTLDKVPAKELAATLANVKRHSKSLPRISKLKPADQLAAEDGNVKKSMEFGRRVLGM